MIDQDIIAFDSDALTVVYRPGVKEFEEVHNTILQPTKFVFIGECDINDRTKPKGFVRLIDEFGNIHEGEYTTDGKRNGWNVRYDAAST